MPIGDCQRGFAEAAAQDDIVLTSRTFEWLSEQGHVALEQIASESRDAALRERVEAAVEVLAAIYARLGGDATVLPAARWNRFLPIDFVHEPTGTLIEVDDSLHFTSFRLTALELYPEDAPLGFDREAYAELCRTWSAESDGYRHGLAAKGFGFGGVQRERAYHDALRDLAAPAMGHPPLVRIPAVDADGAAAYERHRESLLGLLKP